MPQETKQELDRFPWPTIFLSVVTLVIIAASFQFLPLDGPIGKLQALVENSGALGPLVFIIIFALTVVVPPLPERPVILSAGILFHPFFGALLSITGAVLGASINFAITRKFGQHWINSKPRLREYLKRSQALGSFAAIVSIRTFAGFTFDWYSYLVGFLKTKWFVYLLGTLIGITPGTFLEVYSGSFLLKYPYVTLIIGLISILISLVAYKISPKVRSYGNKLTLFSKYQLDKNSGKGITQP